MKELIKKYVVILIVINVLSVVLSRLALLIFPDLLTRHINGGSSTLGIGFLERGIKYLLNFLLAIMLTCEMKNFNFKSILIFICTVLSSFMGIVFFLFALFGRKNNSI